LKARLVFSTMASHNDSRTLVSCGNYERKEYDGRIVEEYADQYGQKVTRNFIRNQDGSQGSLTNAWYSDAAGRPVTKTVYPDGRAYIWYIDVYGQYVEKNIYTNGEVRVTFYTGYKNKTTYEGIETTDSKIYPQCPICPLPPITLNYTDINGREYSKTIKTINTEFGNFKCIHEEYYDNNGTRVTLKYILNPDGSQGSVLSEERGFYGGPGYFTKSYRRDGSCVKYYFDANNNYIQNYVYPDGTVSVRYEYITNPEGGCKVIYKGQETSDSNVYPQCPPLPPAPRPHPNFK
jgi:hypothetical protein